MALSQTEVQEQAIELSEEAFETFCSDISGMFGIEMECSQEEIYDTNIKDLKKRFSKLVAVNTVKADGAMEGNFQLVFDQEGLFTLAGVIVMLPEKAILDNCKRGSAEDAEAMSDSIGEMGNLLVGSWDRVYRDGLEGHKHFVQTNVFIGKPWLKPEQIGLSKDEEISFVPYEMKVGDYPAFHCGVIFPKTVFEKSQDTDNEVQEQAAEQQTQPQPAPEPQPEAKEPEPVESNAEIPEKPEPEAKSEPEEQIQEQAQPEEKSTGKPKKDPPTCKKCGVDHWYFEPCPKDIAGQEDKVTENTDPDTQDESAEQPEPPVPAEPKKPTPVEADPEPEPQSDDPVVVEQLRDDPQPVSKSIQNMAKSPAILPGEQNVVSLSISAKDIMEQDVVWGGSEETVQQALTKMQQNDAGYMLIGSDDNLEGIISKSDITGAISPYLRPVFSKWRRPLDDATLQIKVKWIMTRPVNTVTPEASLSSIMENMSRFGGRCLPVMDSQGKILGLVTVFSIFNSLLKNDPAFSRVGKAPQAPQLV